MSDGSIKEPGRASVEDLCTFHDPEYVDFVLSYQGASDSTSPRPQPPPQKRKRSPSTDSSSSKSSKEDPCKTFGLEYVYPFNSH
jgi:hypothetical protein